MQCAGCGAAGKGSCAGAGYRGDGEGDQGREAGWVAEVGFPSLRNDDSLPLVSSRAQHSRDL